MKRFIMCKGLPGCGKSTYAEKLVLDSEAGKAVRVNRDLLRTMLNADRFAGRKTEQFVEATRDSIIHSAMLREMPLIICDDTNFHTPSCEDRFREMCRVNGYEFVVQDFTDVPAKTCIERDLKRARSVGKDVIMGMWKRYLKPAPVFIEQDETLPVAILVDIDGTLAIMGDRSPYEWHRVDIDTLSERIKEVVELEYEAGAKIILMSGRDGSCRELTEAWLERHGVVYDELHMRAAGDQRKDAIVKRELFDAHVAGKYFVKRVYDDRNSVVEMWRSMGLVCLAVAEGDF